MSEQQIVEQGKQAVEQGKQDELVKTLLQILQSGKESDEILNKVRKELAKERAQIKKRRRRLLEAKRRAIEKRKQAIEERRQAREEKRRNLELKKTSFPLVLARVIENIRLWTGSVSCRYLLNHILLKITNRKKLVVEATDGRALAFTHPIKLEDELPCDGEWLLEPENIKNLRKNLRKAEKVELKIEEGKLVFRLIPLEVSFFVSPAGWDKFPDCLQAVPKELKCQGIIEIGRLKDALAEAEGISLKIDCDSGGSIYLKSAIMTLDGPKEVSVCIGKMTEGSPLHILLAQTYLQRMARQQRIDDENLKFKACDATSPVLFEGQLINWLIAPIR